jgi:hypothetical protein
LLFLKQLRGHILGHFWKSRPYLSIALLLFLLSVLHENPLQTALKVDWPLHLSIRNESPNIGSDTYLLLIGMKVSIDKYPTA